MSISVVCQKCGKGLKVKDEWSGRRATCPSCGATFIVPAAGVGTAGPTAFNPSAAAAAKAHREKEAGSFSVSPGLIIGVVAIVVVCGTIGAFLMGPKKVWNQWEALGDKPNTDVIDVVSRSLQSYMSQNGMYNPRKARNTPQANEVMFYRPSFVMSMPEKVEFKGTSTAGMFKGSYHPKDGEVEASVEIGGFALPVTGVVVRKGNMTINVTGRVKNHQITAEVNGKKAVILIPPPSDDDR